MDIVVMFDEEPTEEEPNPPRVGVRGEILLSSGRFFTVRLPISGQPRDKRCMTSEAKGSSVWSFSKTDPDVQNLARTNIL